MCIRDSSSKLAVVPQMPLAMTRGEGKRLLRKVTDRSGIALSLIHISEPTRPY